MSQSCNTPINPPPQSPLPTDEPPLALSWPGPPLFYPAPRVLIFSLPVSFIQLFGLDDDAREVSNKCLACGGAGPSTGFCFWVYRLHAVEGCCVQRDATAACIWSIPDSFPADGSKIYMRKNHPLNGTGFQQMLVKFLIGAKASIALFLCHSSPLRVCNSVSFEFFFFFLFLFFFFF